MKGGQIPISKWDGQLPSHMAKSEQIWWKVMPNILTDMSPRLFGGVKDNPSSNLLGKVILISETREELRSNFGHLGGSLLNYWGCYCTQMIEQINMVYMAGEATKPFISFTVSPGALSTLVLLKFSENIEEDTSLRDTS